MSPLGNIYLYSIHILAERKKSLNKIENWKVAENFFEKMYIAILKLFSENFHRNVCFKHVYKILYKIPEIA